jgi:predicted nucleotidyltransferase/uncharacterized protein (UPF0332 family)
VEFKISKKDNPNKDKYKKDDVDIAYEFSKKAIKEFGSFIKSIVLFGSAARSQHNSHDIDILVVVDDVSIVMTDEMVEAYRVIMEKIITQSSRKLHITTLKMTNFWDYIRKGDPIGLNILRDGVGLYDMGLFEPLRILLAQGKISPSIETMNIYVNKAIGSQLSSKNHMLQATLDLYWGAIDISHAALMKENIMPTSPASVAEKLEEVFVRTRKLERRYANIMKKFYDLSKSIIHNEKTVVSGAEYDRYQKEANLFIDRMKKLIRK